MLEIEREHEKEPTYGLSLYKNCDGHVYLLCRVDGGEPRQVLHLAEHNGRIVVHDSLHPELDPHFHLTESGDAFTQVKSWAQR